MALLLRQTRALVWKNILIILFRHPFTTPLRAFLLPVIFVTFLAFARNLFIPPSKYGIGNAVAIRSLPNALTLSNGGRDTVAFVNNGFNDGAIQQVIEDVAGIVRGTGTKVQILEKVEDLTITCASSFRGVSRCFAGAVFYGSPSEGRNPMWNYTLRADGALGFKVDVTQTTNDAEIYILPLQRAIDSAIARRNGTIDQAVLPDEIYELPFTSITEEERKVRIRTRYMGGIVKILAVAFFIAIVGVIYQLVGLIASERELGMTQLIEASMPNAKRWQPQLVRFISYHIAFDLMFLPGWICIGVIFSVGIFQQTSLAINLFNIILAGLTLSSFSIFGAAFFRKAQLSGIITTIVSLLLAVLAQIIQGSISNGAVVILGLLFPPMNYTFLTIFIARWERQNLAANLLKAAPESPFTIPGIVFLIIFIVQIFIFLFLASMVERALYGTNSKGRHTTHSESAVQLTGFTKIYASPWWARWRGREPVNAVNDLNLTVQQGQIMVLLGANGSGKSTTLDAIAGLNTVTAGTIAVDGRGGLGICPQKNVLWDLVTATEHVKIFNQLKSVDEVASKTEIIQLLKDCDLDRKAKSLSKNLSGGQKRKLQLSLMFTGGSKVCCVDECSSGVDALARSKLWNILLNERGRRTIILTTHFLDEADLLSDQIAILSKGSLKAVGSAVELKQKLGEGFRVNIFKNPGEQLLLPQFDVASKELVDRVILTCPDSGSAASCIRQLDAQGIKNYEISSPTIEEIFFNVAETTIDLSADTSLKSGESLDLQTGNQIAALRQAFTLFRKRWTVLRRNYLPHAAAFLIPVVAAGLVTLFLKGFESPGCSLGSSYATAKVKSFLDEVDYNIPIGPPDRINRNAFGNIEAAFGAASSSSVLSNLTSSIKPVNGDLAVFQQYIAKNFSDITPGGFFLDQRRPTFAYKADAGVSLASITLNVMDILLTNISISTQYQFFDIPGIPADGKNLQLIVYFGLALCAYPAFFALYPTLERLRSVRQLHYSNGVKSATLWSAYLTFDFIISLIANVLVIIIFRVSSDAWFHIGYLFVVLVFYGSASILLSYVISLFAKSQLAAFAFIAGGQAVMFLLYFIAYLSVLTYVPPNMVDKSLNIVHFTISAVSPSACLIRSMFIALNVFATDCDANFTIATSPGRITLYGGPILYLILQTVVLFLALLWWDSSSIWARIRTKSRQSHVEEKIPLDDDVANEILRVRSSDDGLRVNHVSKSFGTNVAVDDVTFGVQKGEVFALLGPNGAGKSTTISLIRGDIQSNAGSGEIYVESVPLSKHRAGARSHLGVCPQVDACDQMTVLEHLQFYARIRGVPRVKVQANVDATINAVGLTGLERRMAAKLSGGNKRKLSLGIALMGNPSVLLLDEPSSGMDVVAKRIMWRTLAAVVPGRSLVLTTHSMEEADALADRAGILGRRMLAIGTSESLRKKFGDQYHVHLIASGAPHTSDLAMARIRDWIVRELPGAIVEDRTFHGQVRFRVPAQLDSTVSGTAPTVSSIDSIAVGEKGREGGTSGIGALFTKLESNKRELGFEYFSVSQTTLDQVFLSIVGKHQIEEENYERENEGRVRKTGLLGRLKGWSAK